MNADNIGKIHNLSSRALELIEEDFENRTLYLVKEAFEKKMNAIKIIFMRNNYRVLKISGGALGLFLMLVGSLLLVPTSDTVAAKKIENKVEVLAAKTPAKLEKVSETTEENLVDELKQELEEAKKIVDNWKSTFKAAKTAKEEAQKLDLYASLIESGKTHQDLWNAYPKHQKIEKYFNIRIKKLMTSVRSRNASAKSRRESFESLLSKKHLLQKSALTEITLYENSLEKEIKASWVKAAFDPQAVRAELQAVSALLPADHKFQADIKAKIEAL